MLTWCCALAFPVCARSPPEAQEGAGVCGAPIGPAGDPLVVQVQHLGGARPLRGAAALELRHPPQRGRRHRVADHRTGGTILAMRLVGLVVLLTTVLIFEGFWLLPLTTLPRQPYYTVLNTRSNSF